MSSGVKVVNNSYTPLHIHGYFLHFLHPNIKYEVNLDLDQFQKGGGARNIHSLLQCHNYAIFCISVSFFLSLLNLFLFFMYSTNFSKHLACAGHCDSQDKCQPHAGAHVHRGGVGVGGFLKKSH